MDYTLASIRDRVINDKLDDDAFDGDTVDRFINDTQREIFNTYELPFMEDTFSGLMPISQQVFELPVNCQLIQAATITSPDGSQLDIMPLFMDFRTFVSKYPTPALNPQSPIQAWTLYAGSIYTSSPIDKAYTLKVFFIKKPTALEEGTSVPDIPEEFSEALVLGAFKRVLERNEDYDIAAVIGSQYQAQLDKMVNRYGFRMSNGPVRIKQPLRGPIRRR